MFGFFKKKDDQEVELEKVESLVKKELAVEIGNTENILNSSLGEAMKIINELDGLLTELKNKDSDKKYSNTLKDKFSDRSREALRSITKPGMNYSEMEDFLKKIKKANEKIENIDIKELRHLREFKADMNKIVMKTKLMDKWIKNFEKTLEKNSILKKNGEIKNNINKIEESQERMKSSKEKIRNIEHSIAKQKEIVDDYKINYDRTKKYEEMKEKMREQESEMSIIRQKINTEFGVLEKPLRKFLYIKKDMTIHKRNLITKYIENSGESFLVIDRDEIKNILEELIESFENKEIEVDEKRLEKINGLVRSLDFMSAMRKQYHGLEEKINHINGTLKKEYEPLLDEIRKEELKKEELKKRLEDLETSHNNFLKEEKDSENSFIENKIKLEQKLSEILKRKIEIKI